jgi:hypothetical protein
MMIMSMPKDAASPDSVIDSHATSKSTQLRHVTDRIAASALAQENRDIARAGLSEQLP